MLKMKCKHRGHRIIGNTTGRKRKWVLKDQLNQATVKNHGTRCEYKGNSVED